jgi:hypothetical protein
VSNVVIFGPLDKAALALLEHLVRTKVEPRFKGIPLWDNGVGTLAECAVNSTNLVNVQLSGDDLARAIAKALGLKTSKPVPRQARVIDVTGGPV